MATVLLFAAMIGACGVPTESKPVAVQFKSEIAAPRVPRGVDPLVVYFVQDGVLAPTTRLRRLPSKTTIPRRRLRVPPPFNGTTTKVEYQDEPLADWNARVELAQRQTAIDTLVEGVTADERADGLSSALDQVGLGPQGGQPLVLSQVERGVATVTFGESFDTQRATGDDFRLALAQIVLTITRLPGIGQVVFARVVPGGKGVDLIPVQGDQGVGLEAGTPLTPQDFADFLTGEQSPSV